MSCSYCNEKGFTHIHSNDIIKTLSNISKSDRAVIIRFIKELKSKSHHTTITEGDIEDTYCYSCGSDMERDDDGDRYYYLCTNMDCKSWNGGDVI